MELVNKTIGMCLAERAAQSPEHTAVETEDRTYTWRELDEISDYLAVRMDAAGIRRASMVGIWGTNTADWIITFLAAQKLGAAAVLLNTSYCEEELEEILRYADVEYLYYGRGYKKAAYESIAEKLKERMADKPCVWIPMEPGRDGGPLTEDSFTDEEKSEAALLHLKQLKAKVKDRDLAAILFTSGTTSIPKGVMLSHYSLVNSSLETCEHMKWQESDKMLIAVPMFHCFGITSSLLSSIHCGFVMHLNEYYRSVTVLQTVQKYRCTLLNGVPSMFLALIKNRDFEKYDISSLRSGIIAGSPISREEYMMIRRKIPSLKLHASYGQTETSPCVSIGDVEDTDEENAAAAGRVIAHTSVRIADISDGHVLERGKDGEIQVKGYNIMMGYYKLPEVTKRTIEPDGWLHTGDLGYLDEQNFLYVTGRIKEIIIRGGENISPVEIENAVKGYPGIENVKVVGVPAQVLQEQIAACVTLKEGVELDEKQLVKYMKGRVAHYKVPEYVLVFDALPMNASGKILLKPLKEEAADRVEKIRKQALEQR